MSKYSVLTLSSIFITDLIFTWSLISIDHFIYTFRQFFAYGKFIVLNEHGFNLNLYKPMKYNLTQYLKNNYIIFNTIFLTEKASLI